MNGYSTRSNCMQSTTVYPKWRTTGAGALLGINLLFFFCKTCSKLPVLTSIVHILDHIRLSMNFWCSLMSMGAMQAHSDNVHNRCAGSYSGSWLIFCVLLEIFFFCPVIIVKLMTYWSSVQSSNSMPEYELIKQLLLTLVAFDVKTAKRERESKLCTTNMNMKCLFNCRRQINDKRISSHQHSFGSSVVFSFISHSSFLFRLSDTQPLPCITMT